MYVQTSVLFFSNNYNAVQIQSTLILQDIWVIIFYGFKLQLSFKNISALSSVTQVKDSYFLQCFCLQIFFLHAYDNTLH